jgi:short-subunit dehydrogenase
MLQMQKKVIWIVGASSGIGKALALKFAKENWIVIISARRKNLLIKLNEINNNIKPYPLDVTNEKQCISVFKNITKIYKNIEVCVFGSGVNYTMKNEKFDPKKIKKIMEVNYFGVINLTNAVYNYFKKKKSGQISFIASVAGYKGLPKKGAYCASKSSLITFAESLYFDFIKFNIQIKIINPGFIESPMTKKNNFFMPMIQSSDYAANKIYDGLVNKKSFEIHFPKSLTLIMKIVSLLPYCLFFYFIQKANKFIKN